MIAGAVAAVERASELCKQAGAKRALPLPVSAPFHTSMMRPAADRLAEQITLTKFRSPITPVVHNVTAQSELNAEKIKALMIEQIYSPVRWVDCVNTLSNQGIVNTVECGPGKVLSGLNKRINPNLKPFAIETPEEITNVLAAFNAA